VGVLWLQSRNTLSVNQQPKARSDRSTRAAIWNGRRSGELCFADTLDPDGREYIGGCGPRQIIPLFLAGQPRQKWSNPAMNGYILAAGWANRGNVSLIPYYIRSQRYYLIANVAVHPEPSPGDRQTAGRAGDPACPAAQCAVGVAACARRTINVSIYICTLGFAERARRTTWFSMPEFSQPAMPPGLRFTTPSGQTWASNAPG